MPTGVQLDPLPGHSQLVGSQVHDVERVHHLPRLRQLLGGGGVIAGESVHRHDFHPVAEGLLPGGEPAAQHLSGSARHHVQQPGGPGAVHVRRQVDDDGDETGSTVIVDTILRTVGFSVTDEGHIVPATTGATGAAALTEHLQHKLIERGVHPTVLEYCNEDLVNQSLFHAVTEAAKSLMERLRPEWIALDGEKLVQAEFGTRNSPGPRFINNLSSPADEASHFGFIHLLNGIYGHLRNDRAHRARLGSHNDEQDFLDAMAMISYAHRVLDRSSKADNDG